MINEYDMHKIIDDFKMLSKMVTVFKEDLPKSAREKIVSVFLDIMQKIIDDIEEAGQRKITRYQKYADKMKELKEDGDLK